MGDRRLQEMNTPPVAAVQGGAPVHPAPAAGDDGSPFGRFRLGRELGRGGMGRVVEALDPELGRTVAIKVLLEPSQASPVHRSRFVAEAQITAQLDHPNTCPVHEIGLDGDGQFFMVMKRVRGRSLRQVLDSLARGDAEDTAAFTPHRLLTAFVQVCHAAAYAHDRGVLHRDLKPENIMLGAYGEVLVMDWGVARVMGEANDPDGPEAEAVLRERVQVALPDLTGTVAGKTVGTPGFMSPEQARGRLGQLDGRSDVWSLGAVLYEILTLERAFKANNPAALMLRAATSMPDDPRQRAPGRRIDEEIAAICLRAMCIRKDERFRGAAELGRAVEQFLDGSLRRERAVSIVGEARGRLAAAEESRAAAGRLGEEAALAIGTVPAWAPIADKRAAWAKQDAARETTLRADHLETEAVELLHSAFQFFPALPEARDTLADLYRRRLEESEAARDEAGTRRNETLCRTYGEERHAAFLRGDGALTLVTEPSEVRVTLRRYEEIDRRLVARGARVLGTTPLADVPLERGSYLLVLDAPGRATVRYPVRIGRGAPWDGASPGGIRPEPVPLPPAEEVGPSEVYVPAGWFLAGGDPEAAAAPPRTRAWAPGFIIDRDPVTNAGYLEFLNDLVAQGREAEALRWAPRERSGSGEVGALSFGRAPDGRFVLSGDVEGDMGHPDLPVTMVDWECAAAFAAWRAARTGHPWRLPGEWEWEKAARGVDGRFHPWGDGFDPTWCCMRDSRPGRARSTVTSAFPTDESPYGVRGMAGNSRDWCADPFTPGGDLRPDAPIPSPVRPAATGAAVPLRVFRGGAWFADARRVRSAYRDFGDASNRWFGLGFRLARSWEG